MQLQMLMDLRSKLLQTASDIEKSVADMNEAIVGNIKQVRRRRSSVPPSS